MAAFSTAANRAVSTSSAPGARSAAQVDSSSDDRTRTGPTDRNWSIRDLMVDFRGLELFEGERCEERGVGATGPPVRSEGLLVYRDARRLPGRGGLELHQRGVFGPLGKQALGRRLASLRVQRLRHGRRTQLDERRLRLGVRRIVDRGRMKVRDRSVAIAHSLERDAATGHMEPRPLDRHLRDRRERAGHFDGLRPAPQLLVAATERLEDTLGLRRHRACHLERFDGPVGVAELRLQDPRNGNELTRLLSRRGKLVQAMAAKLERARPIAHLGGLCNERMDRRPGLGDQRRPHRQDLFDGVFAYRLGELPIRLDRREVVAARGPDEGRRRQGSAAAREGEALRDLVALRGGRGSVVHARDQRFGRRWARLLVRRRERESRESDAVDRHAERPDRGKHRIAPGLRTERAHGLRQDSRRPAAHHGPAPRG